MLAIHPGEILREEYMAPLGLSANALAIALGIPATRIHEILHEKRGVSTDTAMRLARYFGTDMEMWTTCRRSMKPAFWKGKRGRSSCGSSRIGLYRLPFSSYGKVYLSRHLVGRGSGVCGAVHRVSQLVMAGRGTGRGLAWNRPASLGYVEGHGSEQGAAFLSQVFRECCHPHDA